MVYLGILRKPCSDPLVHPSMFLGYAQIELPESARARRSLGGSFTRDIGSDTDGVRNPIEVLWVCECRA